MAQQVAYAGTGRRKDAVARVRLVQAMVRSLLTTRMLLTTFHCQSWLRTLSNL